MSGGQVAVGDAPAALLELYDTALPQVYGYPSRKNPPVGPVSGRFAGDPEGNAVQLWQPAGADVVEPT